MFGHTCRASALGGAVGAVVGIATYGASSVKRRDIKLNFPSMFLCSDDVLLEAFLAVNEHRDIYGDVSQELIDKIGIATDNLVMCYSKTQTNNVMSTPAVLRFRSNRYFMDVKKYIKCMISIRTTKPYDENIAHFETSAEALVECLDNYVHNVILGSM